MERIEVAKHVSKFNKKNVTCYTVWVYNNDVVETISQIFGCDVCAGYTNVKLFFFLLCISLQFLKTSTLYNIEKSQRDTDKNIVVYCGEFIVFILL